MISTECIHHWLPWSLGESTQTHIWGNGNNAKKMEIFVMIVPQGSILGPLHFIAFINDLLLHVSSAQIDLYTDDTTLTSAANFDFVGVLQSSLTTAISERVDQWATANKLPLNEGKTKVLTITGKRLSTRIKHDLAVVVNGSNWRMFDMQSFWV